MAKKKPYRYPLYLLVRFAAWLLYLLPRRVALFLAKGLGWIAFHLISRQRKEVFKNLRFAYKNEKSSQELNAIAKGVFQNMTQTAVEILQSQKFAGKDVHDFVDVGDAFDVYRSLLKEEKGLISITAHLGNWELLAGVFGLADFQGAVVGRRVYYEPYNQWIVGLRQSLNVRTIYREQAAREVSKLLKQNMIVGILPDQDVNSLRGVFVPFFGELAYTAVAPVRFALSTGAPIIVNFLVRQKNGRYKLIMGKVIRPQFTHDREEAVKKYTEEWMQEFEKVIRQYPDQWGWMHNRWKTKPPQMESGAPRRELVNKS